MSKTMGTSGTEIYSTITAKTTTEKKIKMKKTNSVDNLLIDLLI